MTATTVDLLLDWDRSRPRSQQRQIGWSELGGCRRRAGYRLAGVEPTNDGGSVQAVLGTVIHEAVAERLREIAQPGDLVEEAVTFGGVLGHLDRYEAATASLIDTKTTSSRRLDTIRDDGPPQSAVWQINGYAAGLITRGIPVRLLVLDYVARDTGATWQWTSPPDPQQVRDALAWLREVRETDVEWLPRDYDPDSVFCRGCQFRDVCWPDRPDDPIQRDPRAVLFDERPDAAAWAAQLEQARADKADAEKREKEAKGALDALRPNVSGSATLDVGYGKQIRWTYTSRTSLDQDQVRADYEAAGATAPVKTSSSVALRLVKPKAVPS